MLHWLRTPAVLPLLALLAGCTRPLGAELPADAGTRPDAAGFVEGCEGAQAKIWRGIRHQEGAFLTITRLVMDCCDGIAVHGHTDATFGYSTHVILRVFGVLEATRFDLSDPPVGWEVSFHTDDGAPEWRWLTATGGIELQLGSAEDVPARLSLCLQGTEGDGEVASLWLYAPDLPVAPWSWDDRVGLHLLADEAIAPAEAQAAALETLPLEPVARLGLGSIAWYRWSTHEVALDGQASWYLESLRPLVGVAGRPFVLVVDGVRRYLGTLMVPESSFSVTGPVIVLEDAGLAGFTIDLGYPAAAPDPGPDPRPDPALRAVLEAAGRLIP